MTTAANNPSWAAAGLDQAMRGGSDPRRAPRPPADELGDVSEVRLVADHDEPGALYVMVFGSSPMPMLSWKVPSQFLQELLRPPESHAMIRARAGHRNVTLVTPPGELPGFMQQ